MDELFDYPWSDQLPLADFVYYLNQNKFNAVLVNMLELVADKPLSHASDDQETLKHENYQYYDHIYFVTFDVQSAINREMLREFRVGGIRASYFGWNRGHLNKYPLVKFYPGFGYLNSFNHNVTGDVRLADVSGVLLHYQFTQTLSERCIWASDGRMYGGASRKYRQFLEIVKRNPDVNLVEKALVPVKYTGVNDLIETGFVQAGSAYKSYVRDRNSMPEN